MERATYKKRLNNLDSKEWIKATKSWFVINPRKRSHSQIRHPAKFPEELVTKFVRFFSIEKDWVLDPFAGVGSTQIACKQMNRNSVGIELNDEFVQIAKKAIARIKGKSDQYILTGDSLELSSVLEEHFLEENLPAFSYLITSPPYWNMLRKSMSDYETTFRESDDRSKKTNHSSSDKDLGNIERYDRYIELVGRVFDDARQFLVDNAYLTVVVQNMRDTDGTVRPIAWDLASRISETYELQQEQIWCQDDKRLGCWGYPTTYIANVHHHYCLIFQKKK